MPNLGLKLVRAIGTQPIYDHDDIYPIVSLSGVVKLPPLN